jgi:nucleotide-binding universal stress UspA family protein
MATVKKILVPLDGSRLAERAQAYATALSIPTAALLVLLRGVMAHTFPGTDEREPQARALAEAGGRGQHHGARAGARQLCH